MHLRYVGAKFVLGLCLSHLQFFIILRELVVVKLLDLGLHQAHLLIRQNGAARHFSIHILCYLPVDLLLNCITKVRYNVISAMLPAYFSHFNLLYWVDFDEVVVIIIVLSDALFYHVGEILAAKQLYNFVLGLLNAATAIVFILLLFFELFISPLLLVVCMRLHKQLVRRVGYTWPVL